MDEQRHVAVLVPESAVEEVERLLYEHERDAESHEEASA